MSQTIFRYLYNVEPVSEDEKLSFEQLKSSSEAIWLLEDFNCFLRVYHRMTQEEIKAFFEEEVIQWIKIISINVILQSSLDDLSNDDILDSFGKMVYKKMYEICIDMDYPKDRAEQYSNLYSKIYKQNVKQFLSSDDNN